MAIDVTYVAGLFSDVFGVNSPVFFPTIGQGNDYDPGAFSGVSLKTAEPDDGSPVRFGQKTFGAFWLKGDSYPSYDQYTGVLNYTKYADFLMPIATMVDFSRQKAMTKTPTIGSAGTVKEIYGFEDWTISIKGIILPDSDRTGTTNQTIEGQKEFLQKYFEIAGSIKVDGKIFADRNINRITIESFAFTPVQGKPGMMPFSIEATSDEDLILALKSSSI